MESHPRLSCSTLYKPIDNATTMKNAREILLAMAPKGFTLGLSTCYNYTEGYRLRSHQAKQYHQGKDVNAKISLHMPPRTGVQQLDINLHWSTSNVCKIIDNAHSSNSSTVISKDAKAIADNAPAEQLSSSLVQMCLIRL